MKQILSLLTFAVILFACTQEQQKAPQIPLEDFFRNPEKTAFRLSPNGEYFSYLAPWESRLNVFVQEMGADSAVRITSETERDIAGYLWKGNDRLLFLKDTGGDENYHLYGVDADGSDLKGLTVFDNVRTTFIDDLKEDDDEVIVGLNKRDATVFDPYRLNVNTGEMTMLAEVQPVFHVDKIKAPLFVAQGANDLRVNKDESDQIVEALEERGIDMEYMVKDNEGHGFRNEENRFDFYRGMITFLNEHLKTKEK